VERANSEFFLPVGGPGGLPPRRGCVLVDLDDDELIRENVDAGMLRHDRHGPLGGPTAERL